VYEDAREDASAPWDPSLVGLEDALVASALPRGEEPLCSLTIHTDSTYGPSDHWPSQEFVAVASMLLPIKAWLSFPMETAKVVSAAN